LASDGWVCWLRGYPCSAWPITPTGKCAALPYTAFLNARRKVRKLTGLPDHHGPGWRLLCGKISNLTTDDRESKSLPLINADERGFEKTKPLTTKDTKEHEDNRRDRKSKS
jgi:hypothetical protein